MTNLHHDPSDSLADPWLEDRQPRSRARRRLSVTMVPLAAAAAVVGLVLVASGGAGPVPSAAAAEMVQHAVAATFTSDAVDFAITESVSVGGQQVDLVGAGGCIVSTPACSFTLSDNQSIDGATLGTLKMVATGTAMYIKFPSLIAQHLPKAWVEFPFPISKLREASGASSVGTNPLAGFAALAREGNSVSRLGPASVDGHAATEYLVQLTSKGVSTQLGKVSRLLPAWMRARDAGLAFIGGTEHVYVGSNGKLLRVVMNESVSRSGVTSVVGLTETVTSYHAHVVVTPPSQGSTMSVSQLEQLASGSLG